MAPDGASIIRGTEKQDSPTRPPLRGRFLLDAKKALQAYRSQKHNAARRGIGWELTFKQWCDWWGEDIERRGNRKGCLQMQRINDAGPYKLGNIEKGDSWMNRQTQARMQHNCGHAPYDGAYEIDVRDDDGLPFQGYASVWERMAR